MRDEAVTHQDTAPVRHARGAARLAEVFAAFLKLGLISFGGPVAHLGHFRAEFVEKRRWISDPAYADLVALCHFLPGPASSQVVFALGLQRAGLIGGFVASLCFTLPSALLMIAFAYGVAAVGDVTGAGWLHGLKLAAVAVVAQAVWGMGKTLCPDRPRVTLCLLAAAGLLVVRNPWAQVIAIALGGVAGYLLYRRTFAQGEFPLPRGERGSGGVSGRGWVAAGAALGVFLVLLVTLPVMARTSDSAAVDRFDAFYRAGSLVFGGGHVVLPLLAAEVVPPGWVTHDQFLAGYGAAQAVPGPLFTFSAYLGAAMAPGRWAWVNGLWCLLAIFAPAWLLIGGTLPFWHRLRAKAWAQAALRGANAAVVGVLLAALWDPVITSGVGAPVDVAAALGAFAALHVWKAPPWAVVIVMAAVGQWVLH